MLFGKPKPLLSSEDQNHVVTAIRAAEIRTTGEIRVYIESHCSYVNPMDRALEIFTGLKMEKTENRNAVLVYVALKDHQYALYGDQEIYKKTGGPAFWQNAADVLLKYLREEKVGEGLAACVALLGEALATHYPPDPNVEKNELPDEIVFGK